MKQKLLFTGLMALMLLISLRGWGQVTIAMQNFDGTNTMTYAAVGGDAYNNSSTSTDRPASATFYTSSSNAYGISNGTATLTFENKTGLGSYISKYFEFRLASWSISSTGNGADAGDAVTVAVSLDGGSNWSNEIIINGNSNAYWHYSTGSGIVSVAYDGDNTPATYSPAGGGNRTTDGYSTVRVSISDVQSQARIKITLLNNSSNERWTIDDVKLIGTLSSSVDNPTSFAAAASSTSQIDLSATANGSGNNILVAYNSVNVFGTPSGSYSVGNSITGGGTVHYIGTAASLTNHTGLSAAQTVYYKAWSVDGSTNYSSGVTANATTLSPEPTNHATGFGAIANSSTQITVTWTDASGGTEPSAYLVKASTGTPTEPNDGTPETDATLVKNINQGTQSAVFSGLNASTLYNFTIWPYTNSGADIDYKTNEITSDQQGSATTQDAPVVPKIFFSEYIEGSSNNKAIEIYNGESTSIDLTNMTIKTYPNGASTPTYTQLGEGTLLPGEVYVIANVNSDQAVLDVADLTSTVTFYNGDDAVELVYNGVTTDIIGIIGNDPGSSWSVGSSGATAEFSLLRKLSISEGEIDWSTSAGTDASNSQWVVMPQDYFSNLGFYGSVFTGATTDWNTSSNWDLGIPTATINTKIPAGKAAEVAYTSQASTNNLNVDGTLTLKSDGDGTGSLIVNGTATGNITAERFIGAANWSTGTDGWHLLSSPVASQAISGVWTPDGASSNDYDFYTWNEANNIWVNFKNTSTSPTWAETNGNSNFTVGRGYVVAYQAESTNTFVGVPNVDDVVVNTLTRTTGAYTDPNDAGFNVLGNPYSSAIKWNDGNWTLTNIATTAKLWNSTSKSYDDLGANDIIPANNGFVVQLTTGETGSITIPKLARTHSVINWQKSLNQNRIRLIAREADDNSSQSSNIVLNFSASGSFDPQFDAVFLGGYAPLFYSKKNDNHLSTYALASLSDDLTIPYGFVSNGANEYEIELIENIVGQTVFLTDLKTNTTQKLSENPIYSFTASAGDSPDRFLLHFGVVGLGEQDAAATLNAYVYDNRLYVNSTLDQAQLAVYDLQGRLVMEQSNKEQGLQTVPLNLPAGVYVVRLTNAKEARSVKINVQ